MLGGELIDKGRRQALSVNVGYVGYGRGCMIRQRAEIQLEMQNQQRAMEDIQNAIPLIWPQTSAVLSLCLAGIRGRPKRERRDGDPT